MSDKSQGRQWNPKEVPQPTLMKVLLRAKASTGIRSPHLVIIAVLMAGLGYVYYNVVTSLHDIYVILFFYPVFYAAIVYRLRGVLATGFVFLIIVLPHTLLISSDANSLARLALFAMFSFLIGGLIATQLNYLERQIEAYQEIAYLNREMSDYIARLESTQRQLVHAEKLSAMGQLAASVAHEINNPLAGVLVYAKLLAKKAEAGTLSRDEVLATLAKMESAVSLCSNVVRSLLDFARQSEPVLKAVAVRQVMDQVMSLTGHQAKMKNIAMTRDEPEPSLVVLGDSRQLQQVFINLVINGIQAMAEGGELVIRTERGGDKQVAVSIRDNGCGIPAENIEKLFTPFFTTKGVKGVGLGLAVSYGIIQRHGGRIEVQSQVDKGSTFTVYLPAYDAKEG